MKLGIYVIMVGFVLGKNIGKVQFMLGNDGKKIEVNHFLIKKKNIADGFATIKQNNLTFHKIQKLIINKFQYNSIILASELPYKIEVGDNFNITAGCDKQFSTCCNKFNNAINFRGEPHLPGTDILLKIM